MLPNPNSLQLSSPCPGALATVMARVEPLALGAPRERDIPAARCWPALSGWTFRTAADGTDPPHLPGL